jgi:hypothetical protein
VPCLELYKIRDLLLVTKWSLHLPNTSASNTVSLFVSYMNSLLVTCLECKYWLCDCSHKARSETAEEFDDIHRVNSVVTSRRDIHTSSFTALVCISDSMGQSLSSNAVVSASQILPTQVHP